MSVTSSEFPERALRASICGGRRSQTLPIVLEAKKIGKIVVRRAGLTSNYRSLYIFFQFFSGV